MAVERNIDGTLKPGSRLNPKGRPPRAREMALLAIGHEIVNAQSWRQVVAKALADALGKMWVNQQLVDDPGSTAQGRNQARVFLRDTMIGKPTEFVKVDSDESPYDLFQGYSDEQLTAILDTIERLQSEGGGGESDSAGTTATSEGTAAG